jgi:hypothetical protein
MSAAARQKAKDLVKLAIDERTPEKERIAAAFGALKIIDKYDLLSSPLDGIMQSDNETVQAAATIFETLTNPDLVSSVKKVARGIANRGGGGGGRRYR